MRQDQTPSDAEVAALRWWVNQWAWKLAQILNRPVARGCEGDYLRRCEVLLRKHERARQRLKATLKSR